jgi:hypothetical protein
MLDRLTREQFAQRVGHSFRLELAEQALELELVEVKSLGSPSAGATWGAAGSSMRPESFSLVFRGPASAPLEQGMYSLSQAGDDDLEPIFLVPIAADDQGRYYEAIFN